MRVLIAFPFNIFPLRSGGALRGYYLLRELARHFDVEAIVIDSPDEIYQAIAHELGEDLKTLKVTRVDEGVNNRGIWVRLANRFSTFRMSGSLKTSSNSTTIAISRTLNDITNRQPVDAAILSTQELAICGTLVRKNTPNALRIMDMHNADHILLKQTLEAQGLFQKQKKDYLRVKDQESNLSRYSDAVFTCSKDDLDTFLKIDAGQGLVGVTIPNGIDIESRKFDRSEKKFESHSMLFCGSLDYPPNVDGLNWFHSKVWSIVKSRLPRVKLVVIGRGLDSKKFPGLLVDQSVQLVGEVDQLDPYYRAAGIAICPLRMGSGTRLKILEAMAFGNPVVSTPIGCEGLEAIDGTHILIRESPSEFASGICQLMEDKEIFNNIRVAARKYVEQSFDWRIIGDSMAAFIEGQTR